MDASIGWWVELPRIVARVRGDAPLSFLHAVTTQDVEGLSPGRGALACVLDEKGRVRAELRILALDDGTALVDAERAARGALLEDLARIAPLSGCEIAEERWRVIAVRGSMPDGEEHSFSVMDDGPIAVRTVWDGEGFDLLGPAPGSGAEPAPFERYEALRIERGRPRFGIDVTEEMLVNETPLLARAVSFTKGCYPGQESVARVHNLGRIRRTLVAVHADTGVLRAGARVVMCDGDDVGVVTSAASTRAIAYVRAEAAERACSADGVPVTLRAL